MKLKSTAWLLALVMCAAPIAAVSMRPPPPPKIANFLEAMVPTTFGEWRKVDEGAQIIDPATKAMLASIYPEVLSRTYVNKAGYRVMLSIARSANQIGIQQAHRPEVCYPAQGFTLEGKMEVRVPLTTTYGSILVNRMTAGLGSRVEPVTYWLTMGDEVVDSQWDKRMVQIRALLTGENPGGLLFRVSSIDGDSKNAFAMQQKFVASMMKSVPAEARSRLAGLKEPAGAT
jgi:EpsI family protein